MDLRRYSERHDSVLKIFGDFVKSSLPPLYSFIIDHPTDTYSFPHHITPTNLRPDIVWWGECQRELWLFELTISYETLMERKRAKYQDLVEAGRAAGFKTELITVEVGSRGMMDPSDLEPLAAAINCHHKDIETLCLSVIRTTILGSFKIWSSRNTVTT